ncbi:MAG: PEP-CTERM sorting domain-containing protein [Burkholderiaceae bacterium]|nr:PEP-CTERM sorting domain-containing protein [Burkholderiaceae bacterium]
MKIAKSNNWLLAFALCAIGMSAQATVVDDFTSLGTLVDVTNYDPNVSISLSGAPGGNRDAYAYYGVGITDNSDAGLWVRPTSGNMSFSFQGEVTDLSFDVNWQGANPVTGYGVTYADNFSQWISNTSGGVINVNSDPVHGAIADLLVSNGCNGANVGACYTAFEDGSAGNWNYNVTELSYDGFTGSSVPEPGSLALIAIALTAAGLARRNSQSR